jgi:hypothetical protein
MTRTSELAHLFRTLKALAAAHAAPKLAARAREEEWSDVPRAGALDRGRLRGVPRRRVVNQGGACDEILGDAMVTAALTDRLRRHATTPDAGPPHFRLAP